MTVECSVTRAGLQPGASSAPAVGASSAPSVDVRQLPISVLGTGRMGLAEKTQAYIHQVWLEYGPAVEGVREANCSVRAILSDMGTEFAIGDVKDIVRECKGQQGPALPGPAEEEVRQLFPWRSLSLARSTSSTMCCRHR